MNSLYITNAMYPFLKGMGGAASGFAGFRYQGSMGGALGHIYLSGTQLSLNNDKSADFYNPLVPSGSVIYRWDMAFSFTAGHAVPPMPLLKRGHKYQLKLHADVDKTQGIYMRVLSFDYYNSIINTQIIKESVGTFTYPKNAYFYAIDLIGIGMSKMHFERLDIVETDTKKVKKIDYDEMHKDNIEFKEHNVNLINKFLPK